MSRAPRGVVFAAGALENATPSRMPHQGSLLRRIVRPGGPTLMPRITIWTTLVHGPQVRTAIVEFQRHFQFLFAPEIMELLVSFVPRDDNVFFLRYRDGFNTTYPAVTALGPVPFRTLVLPTLSWRMASDIDNLLYLSGAPIDAPRLDRFLDDIVETWILGQALTVTFLRFGSVLVLAPM